jgi:hypothetical protein
MNQTNRNAHWNINSWLQSNTSSLDPIAAKMVKKSPKNWKKSEICCSWGITLAKINQSHRNTNWNSNFWLQSNTPRFNPIAAKMAKFFFENRKWPQLAGWLAGQHNNIICPVFRRAYKNMCVYCPSTDPIFFFTLTLKHWKIYNTWKFCLPLEPNIINSWKCALKVSINAKTSQIHVIIPKTKTL